MIRVPGALSLYWFTVFISTYNEINGINYIEAQFPRALVTVSASLESKVFPKKTMIALKVIDKIQ